MINGNIQEQRVLDTLCSKFDLPIINLKSFTLNEYISERKNTLNGFIGYQVPRKGIDRIYRNDFVIYIPNKIDCRIECKSLDTIGSLSRAVVTEEYLITSTMIEKKLILFVEGIGYNSKEFLKTIKACKSDETTLIKDISTLFKKLTTYSRNIR